MADNPLKRLREEIEGAPPRKKVSKVNHTLYLDDPQYKRFRNYCHSKNIRPSEVVDRLIAMYLAEVADDVPAE